MHALHNFVRRLRVIGARAVQQTHHFHVIHRDSAIFDSCSIDNVVEPAIVRLAVVVPTVEKIAQSLHQSSFCPIKIHSRKHILHFPPLYRMTSEWVGLVGTYLLGSPPLQAMISYMSRPIRTYCIWNQEFTGITVAKGRVRYGAFCNIYFLSCKAS